MCNPNRIPEVVKELKKKCLVFSFGSSNDFSFEASVLKDLPGCEVHTFDHTIVPRNVPKGVHFHSWGLGAKDYGSIRTLSTIMKHLNFGKKHSLEVLKLDIEGAGKSIDDLFSDRFPAFSRRRMGTFIFCF